MFYVYLVFSFIICSCFGADPESSGSKGHGKELSKSRSSKAMDVWEQKFQSDALQGYLKEAQSIYGDPNTLYRAENMVPAQRKKMLQELGKKKTDLIELAKLCMKEHEGEKAARDIMELVGCLEFSIVEANGGAKTFKVSPRVFEVWQNLRATEAALSSEQYLEASKIHKECIKSPRQYNKGKTRLLDLANEAFESDEEQTCAAIVQLIGDLECNRAVQSGVKGSIAHTPRTQEVIDKLDQKGVKRVKPLKLPKDD